MDTELAVAQFTSLVAKLERDNKRALAAKMKEAQRGQRQEEAEDAAIEREINRMMKQADNAKKGIRSRR